MAISSFYDLEVWQLSMDLAVQLYDFIRGLPREELYVLSDQMRRAVISVPSNIAEGQKRCNPKEFKHFLYYSRGSLGELMTQLNLCNRLGYISDEELDNTLNKCEIIDRKINNLINSLPDKLPNKHSHSNSNNFHNSHNSHNSNNSHNSHNSNNSNNSNNSHNSNNSN